MGELSHASLVWNRACGGRRLRELAGDWALAGVISVHGLVMNGGVFYAVDCMAAEELEAAKAGYRFYGYEAVADVLTEAADDLDEDEDLSEEEGKFNQSYNALIPDDGYLAERFRRHFEQNPSDYAPLRPGDEKYWP
jgi:hypothetical protein